MAWSELDVCRWGAHIMGFLLVGYRLFDGATVRHTDRQGYEEALVRAV